MKRTINTLIVIALLMLVAFPLAAHGSKEQAEKAAATAPVEETKAATTTPIVVPTVSNERVTYAEISSDNLISSFNYSYGYALAENFLAQGVSFDGGYFGKGIIDGIELPETLLVPQEEMDAAITDYKTQYFDNGITQDGGKVLTEEEIRALETPTGLVERFSYTYGLNYSYQLYYSNGLDIEALAFMQGALDAIHGFDPIYTEEERTDWISQYQMLLQEEYNAYVETLAASNLETANAFFEANKDVDGMVNLEDKVILQLIFEDENLGATPTETDTVIVDYTLYTIDGNIVDQGADVEFPLTSLIPGFVLACTNMQVGQEVYAYIHPDYGYGVNGAGSSIEPNALLIFDIYLKGIVE